VGGAGHEVNQLKYTHDAWGNVTSSIQDPNGAADVGTDPNVAYQWAYGVDANSAAAYARVEKITLPGGREIYYNYESQYESLAKFASLGRVANIAANASPTDAQKYVAYKYLGASMVVDANHPAVPTGLRLTLDPNGDKAYAGFDGLGRVIDQRWLRSAGSAMDRFGYTYDRASNRLTRSQALKSAYSETYHYDALDRLKDANRPGDSGAGRLDQSWTLSPTGNWSSFINAAATQTRTHNNANEIATISDVTYAPLYDQAGSNVRGPRPADPNANNAAHFRYDAWNRLASVRLDDGSQQGTLDGTDTLLATYRYDGLNRRVKRVVNVDGNSVTDYMYHNTGWQIVEVRRGVNQTPAAAAYKQYAWDIRYIDSPVCRWWDKDSDGTMEPAAGEMQYFTNDGNFNTTALVDANSGSVVERYLYDPYGKPAFLDANWSPISASAFDNEILFCGYWYDPETGLFHVRERYYDPVTGTWKTRDRILYPDGMSLYQYVSCSPANYLDIDGAAKKSTVIDASGSVESIVTIAKDGIEAVATTEALRGKVPAAGAMAYFLGLRWIEKGKWATIDRKAGDDRWLASAYLLKDESIKAARTRVFYHLGQHQNGIRNWRGETYIDYFGAVAATPMGSDLYYLAGSSMVYGQFAMLCTKGSNTYEGYARFIWFDPYDWHKDKEIDFPWPAAEGGEVNIKDKALLKVQEAGKGFSFNHWAMWMEKVKCGKGLLGWGCHGESVPEAASTPSSQPATGPAFYQSLPGDQSISGPPKLPEVAVSGRRVVWGKIDIISTIHHRNAGSKPWWYLEQGK